MTQWFLGPSLIDRIYVLSGGGCHPRAGVVSTMEQVQSLSVARTQSYCRGLGGQWSGGHDVSGHCVMLIHASLFFWEELSWLFYTTPVYYQLKSTAVNAWRSVNAILAVLVLSWWMMVMTAVYFHGHNELLTGSIFGVLGWAILYLGLFPRVPQIGLPSRTL
ncbi:hypothetical protein DM01DRAFT_320633 [Hesseltinella vesiculosa]|uniref:Fat storage-inducing transmembrane protein n=1 Tax=Hesseltinella vesiculosa TaxID=101127 RepID=A0A1X2GS87_9FUNG|nr:hypothetical protein DM01DRAFT_320633 [Hesseltinella vesiculosa]